jgi:hypothetical protein
MLSLLVTVGRGNKLDVGNHAIIVFFSTIGQPGTQYIFGDLILYLGIVQGCTSFVQTFDQKHKTVFSVLLYGSLHMPRAAAVSTPVAFATNHTTVFAVFDHASCGRPKLFFANVVLASGGINDAIHKSKPIIDVKLPGVLPMPVVYHYGLFNSPTGWSRLFGLGQTW